MTFAFKAMAFARNAHRDQRRKYTGNPYTDHLAEVAGIVATVAPTLKSATVADYMVAVAWLHDVMEDQGAQFYELATYFDWQVADGVRWLSDMEEGNRAARKAASRARLAAAPGWVQTIKVTDLISNTSSIVMHDPKFAVTYLEEKRQLLDVLSDADPRLMAIARAQTAA